MGIYTRLSVKSMSGFRFLSSIIPSENESNASIVRSQSPRELAVLIRKFMSGREADIPATILVQCVEVECIGMRTSTLMYSKFGSCNSTTMYM